MFEIFVLSRQLFNVQALLYDTLILREREKYKTCPGGKYKLMLIHFSQTLNANI